MFDQLGEDIFQRESVQGVVGLFVGHGLIIDPASKLSRIIWHPLKVRDAHPTWLYIVMVPTLERHGH